MHKVKTYVFDTLFAYCYATTKGGAGTDCVKTDSSLVKYVEIVEYRNQCCHIFERVSTLRPGTLYHLCD